MSRPPITLSAAEEPQARRLVEYNAESRTSVALLTDEKPLQRLLPAPWKVTPYASGPTAGANLVLIFRNRYVTLRVSDDGRDGASDAERGLVIAIPCVHPESGEFSSRIVRTYTTSPLSVPGGYQNSVMAEVLMVSTLTAGSEATTTRTESWHVVPPGGAVRFQLTARTGVPTPSKLSYQQRGGGDSEFSRGYRVDQAVDVVLSESMGINRVESTALHADLPDLGKVADSQRAVKSILLLPWYLRRVHLP